MGTCSSHFLPGGGELANGTGCEIVGHNVEACGDAVGQTVLALGTVQLTLGNIVAEIQLVKHGGKETTD